MAQTFTPAPVQVVGDELHLIDGEDSDLVHAVCACSPHKALCGMDVADLEWAEDIRSTHGDYCIVCAEHVQQRPCPRCGLRLEP